MCIVDLLSLRSVNDEINEILLFIFAVILELLRLFSPPLLSRPIKNFVMLSTVTIDYGL